MSDEKSEPRPDSKSIPQSFRDAWLSVLGVFSSAEAEVHKATTRLLETFGIPEGARLGTELVARMRKNREEFERRVDEGVKSAIAKVRAPIDKELATLRTRVEKIQSRIEEQKRTRAEKKKAQKAE
jgi:enolase